MKLEDEPHENCNRHLRTCTCHNCGFIWQQMLDPVCLECLVPMYCAFCGEQNPISHKESERNENLPLLTWDDLYRVEGEIK